MGTLIEDPSIDRGNLQLIEEIQTDPGLTLI